MTPIERYADAQNAAWCKYRQAVAAGDTVYRRVIADAREKFEENLAVAQKIYDDAVKPAARVYNELLRVAYLQMTEELTDAQKEYERITKEVSMNYMPKETTEEVRIPEELSKTLETLHTQIKERCKYAPAGLGVLEISLAQLDRRLREVLGGREAEIHTLRPTKE